MKPNEVNEYVIPLHGNDHTFRRGHKIMVQVQSTWFPVIDRNPQKFVENIFAAQEEDFQTATQRVYRSKGGIIAYTLFGGNTIRTHGNSIT